MGRVEEIMDKTLRANLMKLSDPDLVEIPSLRS